MKSEDEIRAQIAEIQMHIATTSRQGPLASLTAMIEALMWVLGEDEE